MLNSRAAVLSGVSPAALLLDFTSGALDSLVTFSRPSLGIYVDSTGYLSWSPNNFLSNSATLSTQSITLNARTYLLSFKGTGSVDLSGTYVATLAGTGSTDRVYLRFTTTSGAALTLTVTGTVTEAQLEAVTYQTTPRPYVATTTSIYYGPRFDYDPVTLTTNGLLIEEARTNLMLYSSEYSNAAWTKRTGTAILAAQITAPDGTLSGSSMYDSASSSGTYIRQSTVTIADNTTYTASIYAKKQGLSVVRLTCYAKTSLSDNASTTLNFDTGVVTTATGGTVTGNAGGAVPVGNGWWRIWTTVNSATGTTAIPFSFGSTNSPTGDGTSSVYIWGAQIEAGAFRTSYIPTAASSIARSADSVTMTGTNFSSWYNQSEGTFLCEFNEPGFALTHQLFYATGTGSDRINIGITGSLVMGASIVSGGANNFSGNSPTVSTGAHKVALAYATNNSGLSYDGASVTTDTNVPIPVPLDRLQIGATSSPNSFMNSTIRKFAYYNTRLQNYRIQQLTT